jgi:type VI secretion system protein ImpA
VNLRDVSNSAVFSAIDDLRREVDPALDDAGGKAANWPAVVRACEQTLTTQSKDLQLAAWLTEALARIDGFAGLQAGLQLIRGLLERYWDTLHPG